MKISWGTGIALVYAAFALSMVAMVLVSRQYDPRLVQKDYYALDLNYQERLERKQNAAALPQDLEVSFDQQNKVVVFKFPVAAGKPAGSVKFSQAAAGNDDFNTDVSADVDGIMQVPADKLPQGRWHVEVIWDANGSKYYKETVVTIIHV
ncbi:MAG TPA: FixH family protein [Saprospiraceae bacterium]|nr:FixH family protein [Saprospiraceae bacterium]HNL37880.1 FixH family protein [Saprospiraceae bacterium]HNM26842.1 FixH family protein [Saprospiraceae bacterium]